MMRSLTFLLASAAAVAEAANYAVNGVYDDDKCTTVSAEQSKVRAFTEKVDAQYKTYAGKTDGVTYVPGSNSWSTKLGTCSDESGTWGPAVMSIKLTCATDDNTFTVTVYESADCTGNELSDMGNSYTESCQELDPRSLSHSYVTIYGGKQEDAYQIPEGKTLYSLTKCQSHSGRASSASPFAALPGVAVVMAFFAIAA